MQTRLRGNPVPIKIPMGAEEKFEGVIDLVRMKAIYWDDSTQGMKFETRDVPANLLDEAKKWREKKVEAAPQAHDDPHHKNLQGPHSSNQRTNKGPATPTHTHPILPHPSR